eukprot:CAMPEP_0184484314 /NCGR_PEP_ID=MMETSP0113_2-20130426/6041_1 /TAXON_ID=91329 /ORGANISM="Norrisiella sphaerica, Strain BC52" /LENGTH=741 /DNA_ID=CAMNT_0026865255 /DNA_START=254 /DNA_END=2477 /DNA_ORIENTATION=+
MYANDILHSEHGPFRSFRVEEMLGKGTFGQVVKAEDLALKKKVAVKVIKNKPAYFRQAAIEIQILTELNQKYDPNNEHSIVRLFDHFQYKNHLCLVFEMLSVNLYELIKQNKFRGLSCNLVRTILKQILKAMDIMYRAGIIHCDLKPENILLSSLASAKIKLIDFGSACTKNQTIYSYIQSRFYRSPEVLLGLPYDMKIDIWSIGCVAAELFLGLPLFPGVSAFNQIFRIVQMLGVPINLCRRSKKAHLYFDHDRMTDEYAIKSIVKYAEENHLKPVPPKEYFKERTLDGLIRNYPYRTSLSVEDIEKERETRMHFIDLLLNLLQLDPERRIRPSEALSHQFITGIKCNTRKESAHDFSPKKRTLGFNVPAGQGIFEHSAPEQGNYNHSALDQGVYKRSALVPMANSRPVPFHTATRYQHGFKVPRVEMKQHEVNSRYHSHPIMINLKQISLGSELADHPPFNHTPVLRAGAHSHSLTMASTPLGGSPVGLYTSHAFSPNHSWKHGSPVHGNHLHNNRLAVSPARGDTKGSPGRGVWIPGPRLHYRQQNLIHTGTSDVMYYGSPERNELKIHPHSWGHNHASMLGYQCGQSAGGYGASQPSFRDPLEDDVNPLNIGAFPAQQDRRFSRSSSFGLRPQSNTSPGVIHHSYHNRRPQHLQHRPRHHHHSPFKKFQPPLRNLIRSNHSQKADSMEAVGLECEMTLALGLGKINDVEMKLFHLRQATERESNNVAIGAAAARKFS